MSAPVWPLEEIPDEHFLYCRVHQTYRTKSGGAAPSAFVGKRNASGMFEFSADWCHYSTPQETRDRATRNPHLNGVYEVMVCELRRIPGESVQHSPVQNIPGLADNRAHSDVIGPDHEDPQVKRIFSRIYTVVIPIP
jgi:hypothetical protein